MYKFDCFFLYLNVAMKLEKSRVSKTKNISKNALTSLQKINTYLTTSYLTFSRFFELHGFSTSCWKRFYSPRNKILCTCNGKLYGSRRTRRVYNNYIFSPTEGPASLVTRPSCNCTFVLCSNPFLRWERCNCTGQTNKITKKKTQFIQRHIKSIIAYTGYRVLICASGP